MTRETKVGLVVACSFLCLVGIVVASKWRKGDSTVKEPELQEIHVAAVKEKQPGNPPIEPAKKNETRRGERPIDTVVAPLPLPPVNSIQPASKTETQIQQELRDAKMPVEPAPLPTFPSAPGGTGTPGPFAGAPPIMPDPKGPAVTAPPLVPPVDANVRDIAQPLDVSRESKNGGVAIPNPVGVRPLAGIEIAQGGTDKPADPLPPFPPVAKDPAPVLPKEPAPIIPPIAKEPAPTFPPIGKDPAPLLPKEPAPTIPPIAKEPAPTFPPIAKDPAPLIPKEPAPAIAPPAKDPIPQIPRDTAPGLPPIVVGGAKPSLPMVKETTLDEYECRQGDSTFANLSMRFYGTDKYADALLLYNRAQSALIRGGSNLNINPPILTPGQKVLNPSKDVLERDYRLNIRDTTVAPPPADPGAAPAVKLTPPTPLVPTPNAGIPTIANPPVGATYRVQNPNGESILDIAERTLGNRTRWTAIYDLNRANPAVQPQFRIPAGTELKMPAN